MAANAKFLFVGVEPKELCALIAPPAHEDRETSVNGEAKSSVEWCIGNPYCRSGASVEALRLAGYLPGTATCASARVSGVLLALYLLCFAQFANILTLDAKTL